MANIVVYGSGWAGIAAAAKAARFAPDATVHLISPYPVAKLGGISTIGGQNFIDLRKYNGKLVQGGSFGDWYSYLGNRQYYNTDSFASYLNTYLTQYSNIRIHHKYDIESVVTATNPYRITYITIRSISRNSSNIIVWGNSTDTIPCNMVIDASDEGRIARTVNSAVITGRFDWPSAKVTSTEHNNKLAKQQAATLMFKVKGVTDYTNTSTDDMDKLKYADGEQTMMYWGGSKSFSNPSSAMYAFNEKHKDAGYMLKPLNAARNGTDSEEFWVNMLMIFNVDGRCNSRDVGTSMYPTNRLSGVYNTDQAYVNAVNFLNNAENQQEILDALHELPGFENAEFVKKNGSVVTGETLYIRETVHMSKDAASIANGTENTNYGLTTNAAHNAGATSSTGGDSGNYATRIGIGFYQSDIHPYEPADCIDGTVSDTRSVTVGTNNYVWAYDSYSKMRGDLLFNSEEPDNPAYLPYSILKTNYVANLILAGYAVNMSSFAWGEMRVFSNQAVIGDAAGVTAAYCYNNSKYPVYLGTSDISVIQTNLNTIGAKLTKENL